MVLTIIYFLINSLKVNLNDESIVTQVIIGLFILFACKYYVDSYFKNYNDYYVEKIFIHLNIAGFLQSIIVILTFLSVDFKDFLYSFIGLTETSFRYLYGDVDVRRYQGIVPSGFSMLSVTHGLLFGCGLWTLKMSGKGWSISKLICFSLVQCTILISILLIGRTGIVVVLIFIISYILYESFDLFFYKSRKRFINYKFIIILFIMIALASLLLNNDDYEKNIKFAFETIISYMENGGLDRSSQGVLDDHYFLPESFIDIIFGTGNFGRSDNLPYIESDVGYILFIFGSGIFGTIFAYSFNLVGLYLSCKYRKLNVNISRFLWTYIIILIVVNFKDYYYISQIGYSQIYFIAICILGLQVSKYKKSLLI